MNALYSIGSNGSGQLGIGHKEDVSVPKPVIFHPHQQPTCPVTRVSAGGNHTLLLTASGELYWSGDPSTGACGLGKSLNLPVFQKVILSVGEDSKRDRITLVAATWEASVIVTESRQDQDGAEQQRKQAVYTFGVGLKGELGAGELIVRTPSATRLADFPPQGTEVVDLHACMGHVVAVLSSGDAYAWGNCRKGQAGARHSGVLHAPQRIEGVGFPVRRAVCCKDATCLFGEPDGGQLLVLGGSDKWTLQSAAPRSVPAWTDVGASWGSIYVLTREGRLLAWGRDDHGQLPPPDLPPLRSMAVGSEHVVALSRDGDVLSWGWGEHGNCGPNVQDNDVKGRWNVIASSKFIPDGSSIALLFFFFLFFPFYLS
ncbi:protein ATS1 [Geosmithia morbida]|uniref:Protein ATS1 n=1 Tax=Geosmithia morbida TaxID=1094350 RepID=A0A9P5D0S2_9HYPO|nr:protein ATS1 [Geosmithia morbida]KAF4119731.1 protein ATS1 [Geosmithia morbida]